MQRYENRRNLKICYFAILNEQIKRRKKRVQRRQKSIKQYKRGRGLPQVQRAWCKHSFSKNKKRKSKKEKNKNPERKTRKTGSFIYFVSAASKSPDPYSYPPEW